MTTTQLRIETAGPGPLAGLAEAIADTMVMARRNLLVWRRTPAFLVLTIVEPIIFVLLFRFVFGGAIKVPSAGGYVNYLMPGIMGQTAAFTSVATAVALARGASKGVIDRYRSMPMSRAAYLGGRLLADAVRMFVTLVVTIGIGYAVGFRFQNGVGPALGMILVGTAFGVAMCSVSALIGLAIKDAESVQGIGLIWVFPMTFVSSAFVPVASMPGWLRAFAGHQPITVVVDLMRALALGGPVSDLLWQSIAWLLAISALFMTLAVRSYRTVR